jgi:tetratricopeptide (TPR) repeat protein
MRKELYGEHAEHSEMAHVLNNIGAEYNSLGDKKEAIRYGKKALKMQRKLFNKKLDGDHPDLIETLENLSAYYSSLEALGEKESLDYALEAYDMQTRLFPNVDHPRTARLLLSIAQSYSNLAIEAKKSGDNDNAKNNEEQAIVKKQKAYEMQHRMFNGGEHPDLATTLQSLGESFRKKREFTRALGFFERAYDMRKKIYNKRPHQHLIESLRSLHFIHFQLGNEKEAKRFDDLREKMEERLEKMEKNQSFDL